MAENVYIEKYLTELLQRKYSPKTIKTRRYPLRRFFSFLAACGIVGNNGKVPIREVNAELLDKFRLELVRDDFSGNSLFTYLATVRGFFAYLEEEGLIFANPAAKLRIPKIRKHTMHVPSVAEVQRLLAAVEPCTNLGIRDRAMIETAYSCALRLNEIVPLKLAALNLDKATLRVLGKGSRERVLPLGSGAGKWLKLYIREARPALIRDKQIGNEHLWLSATGRALPAKTYQQMLHRYAEKAGLAGKVTGHTLRRACATHMLANGASPVVIQHLLGHASLQHLGSYLDIPVSEIRQTHNNSRVGQ